METSRSDSKTYLTEEEVACIGAYLLLLTYPSLEPENPHHIIRGEVNETAD
jgi:hypothetical protein